MLDSNAPLQDEQKSPGPVSPPTLHHASRSSTPGISTSYGAPHYSQFLSLPPRPYSAPPPPVEMIMRSLRPMEHSPPPHRARSGSQGANVPADMPSEPSPVPDATALPALDARPPQIPDLAQLLRLRKYQRRRSRQAQQQLYSLQVMASRTSRLAHMAHSVQHTLAECIKSEDKESFVNLLNAFHDACDDCSPSAGPPGAQTQDHGASGLGTAPFFEHFSSSSSSAILKLLNNLRNDGTFVARRLGALTQRELLALLPDRRMSRSTTSIFGGSLGPNSRSSRPLGFVVDAQVDQLSSRGYGSALEALIYAPMDISSVDARQENRMTEVWATVCHALVLEQRPGSERLVPAVLDIWTALIPWPGKERLDIWILQTLRSGSFLTEQSSKQSFRSRVEGRDDLAADFDRRANAFYTQAALSLLDLFGSQLGASVIPPGVLNLCHAIWNKFGDDPTRQLAFSHFVSTRWLFASFMFQAITLPEAYNMLTDHYLPEVFRHRVLREIAMRAQKMAFEVAYSWKSGMSVPPETSKRVLAVMSRFEGPQPEKQSMARKSTAVESLASVEPLQAEAYLAVSTNDLSIILNSLYPQRKPASVSSDADNGRSGLQSSASSMSGFSLFQTVRTGEATLMDGTDTALGSPAGQDTSGQDLDDHDTPVWEDVLRVAFLELDDFVTGRTTGSHEHVEILVALQGSTSLCTLQQKMSETASFGLPAQREHRHQLEIYVHPTSLRLVSSCREAIDTLLEQAVENATIRFSATLIDEEDVGSISIVEQVRQLHQDSVNDCAERSDFVGVHCWMSRLQDFGALLDSPGGLHALHEMLIEIELTARQSTLGAEALQDACEGWSRDFSLHEQSRSERHLAAANADNARLRDKMWYVCDVRTTAAYDQARAIVAALRIMGRPKRTCKTGLTPPLRHWNGNKVSHQPAHLKNEAQTLEILSARPEQTGPNKLSDDQSRATAAWLDSNGIDKICKGEERLHKLCMEVRRCVDLVTAESGPEASRPRSNALFARDPSLRQCGSEPGKSPSLSSLYFTAGRPQPLPLRSIVKSSDTMSNASHPLSSTSSRDFVDGRSPTLTKRSSIPFWSPTMTEADSPSSATSVGSSVTQSALRTSPRKGRATNAVASPSTLEDLRNRTTSLLLSELTVNCFNDGSETDRAFWTGLGLDLFQRHCRTLTTPPARASPDNVKEEPAVPSRLSVGPFDFESAFVTILQKFAAVANPFTKLASLYDIDRLLLPYMAKQHLEENASRSSSQTRIVDIGRNAERDGVNATETSIRGFRHLFSKTTLRPTTIFRDLQYIASLVPASTLHNTAQGRAFCNAAVAISQLKREARIVMVETADSIIAFHSNNRGHGRTSSTAQQQRDSATFAPSRTPSAEDYSRYDMADAAYLYQIAAREGDPVAQRELATLYLTHPELMDRIIAPFARPMDVFKEELESKWRKNQDPNRCDPITMCVAHHWMSLSSNGGDALAKEYLRQREEMDRLGS